MHIDDDVLAEVTQVQLFCVLFAALLIHVDATGDRPEDQRTLSVVLILISCSGFVVMGATLLVLLKHQDTNDQSLSTEKSKGERDKGTSAAIMPVVHGNSASKNDLFRNEFKQGQCNWNVRTHIHDPNITFLPACLFY